MPMKGARSKVPLPLEDIEARDLKFCIGPYFTHIHALQKERLNLKTF